MKGFIHCHSEFSRYDSTMKIKDLCAQAKKMGYEAVALTDHGTLTGIDDFVAAAKSVGIKPIPGVEAYVQEDESLFKRFHLILIAKDDLGYQGISKAVSESNKRIDSHGFPRMNKEILEHFFGKDSKYHGHVIATSACAGGVLAGMALSPFEFDKQINKIKEKQAHYESPDSETYKRNKKAKTENEAKVEEMIKERDLLSSLAKKPYKKKEKDLLKLEGEEYETAFRALEEEKGESKEASIKLEEVRLNISLTKKNITAINQQMKLSEEKHEKFKNYQKQIDNLESQKVKADDLYQLLLDEASFYKNLFGKENFYIEIQYHGYINELGVDIEEAVMPILAKVSKDLNIPMCAANDAHMKDNSQDSIRARQIIRSIPYAKKGFVTDVNKGDLEIYVKDEEALRRALEHVISKEDVEEAIRNTNDICGKCNCEFKTGDHYPKYQSLQGEETASEALKRMAYDGIKARFDEKSWNETYKKRLDYELSVISEMGYCDYFLIVQDFLAFGRKLGHLSDASLEYLKENVKSLTLKELIEFVDAHQEEVGFAVGAGRGSAAGSLVAYLVGITNIIDPLEYDLLFEREKDCAL